MVLSTVTENREVQVIATSVGEPWAPPPVVSVIIVNHNGATYLPGCVGSVLNSNYPRVEVIVVDNGSTDNSIEEMEKRTNSDGKVKIIRVGSNLGFAKAANAGAREASGQVLVFLNDDTVVDAQWLIEPVRVMARKREVAAVRIRVASMDDHNKFESVASHLDVVGTLINTAEIDASNPKAGRSTVLPHGAAFFIKKSFFDLLGEWDEDYFIYYEDIDLCWRIWVFGGTIEYCGNSLIYHKGSATASKVARPTIFYHFTRNRIQSIIKNYSTQNMLRFLSLYLLMLAAASLKQLLRENMFTAKGSVEALVWNVKYLRRTMRKRAYVQRYRRVTDDDLFLSGFIKNIDWKAVLGV